VRGQRERYSKGANRVGGKPKYGKGKKRVFFRHGLLIVLMMEAVYTFEMSSLLQDYIP
jgi:hypothetical protein